MAEIGEAEAEEVIEVGAVKVKVRVKIRIGQQGQGHPDTPPTHPKAVVTAIISGARIVGTVSHPSHVLGSTKSRLGHEGPTSLE